MKRNSFLVYSTTLALLPTLANAQTWLGAATSATAYYGGALVNFQNVSASPLQLTGLFDLNLGGAGGFSNSYRVYTKSSALTGSELDASAWTLLGSANVASSSPQGTFTTINVGNTLTVAPGATIGVAIFLTSGLDGNGNAPAGGFVGYRSGANNYTDGTATITTGMAKGYRNGFDPGVDQLFNVDTFNPRSWSGRVQYAAVPEPASMAAIGLGLCGLVARRRRKQK